LGPEDSQAFQTRLRVAVMEKKEEKKGFFSKLFGK
jgi:hypothetical protein